MSILHIELTNLHISVRAGLARRKMCGTTWYYTSQLYKDVPFPSITTRPTQSYTGAHT